jgi:hypothetical protein
LLWVYPYCAVMKYTSDDPVIMMGISAPGEGNQKIQ